MTNIHNSPYDQANIKTGKASDTPYQATKTNQQFDHFTARLNLELLNHRVIKNNPYTSWFSTGQASFQQLQALIIQFSIFSNQFLIAQLLKMLNATSIEEMRASKEILANELGVLFNGPSEQDQNSPDTFGDSPYGSTTGSIEGGRFHFRSAHFELLLRCAESIGLSFKDLGRLQLGNSETLLFCNELKRLYGSEDYQISEASSFAIEHWAAAGFWQELVDGLSIFKHNNNCEELPLTFFSWHNKLEANHAHHTQKELETYYFHNNIDEDKFVANGNEMLDAVYTFWKGLDIQRQSLVH